MTTTNNVRKPPSELAPSPECERIIKHFEGGPHLVSYPCSADKWTFGWGSTTWNGEAVQPNMRFTLQQCHEAFEQDVYRHANYVRQNVQVPLSQNEFDALVSMAFNLGNFLPNSNTLQVINSGDYERVPSKLIQWHKTRIDGKLTPLRGLYRRRLAEALLWLGLPWEDATSENLIQLDTPLESVIARAKRELKNQQERERFTEQVKEIVTPKPEPAPQPKYEEKATPPNPEEKKPKDEPKPPSRDSVPLEKIPEVKPGIDLSKGAKPLEESERFVGSAFVLFGYMARYLAALGVVPLSVASVFLEMLNDPAMLAIMIGGGVIIVSQIMLHYGRWKKKRGDKKASQVLI